VARSPEWIDLGSKPRAVSEIIETLVHGGRLKREKRVRGVERLWREVAPPEIVAHTRAERFYKGTLIVVCESSALLSELANFHRADLLAKLRETCKTRFIARLDFKIGKVARES